jgi:hypothetical protein
MSGEQVGEINCLLAFGADAQVTHLEQQKGLRNSEVVLPLSNKPVSACSYIYEVRY